MPFNKGLNSGQMNALPAYAASMCIHMFSSLPGTDKKQRTYFKTLVVVSFFLSHLVRCECVCVCVYCKTKKGTRTKQSFSIPDINQINLMLPQRLTHIWVPTRWCDQKRTMEWCQESHRTETNTHIQCQSALLPAPFLLQK